MGRREALLVLLLLLSLVSAGLAGIPARAAVLQVLLLSAPINFAALLATGSRASWARLRTHLHWLWWLQVVVMVGQYILARGIDTMQGTLVGTGAGAHITPLFVVFAAPIVAQRYQRLPGLLVLVIAVSLAYLADAKQVLLAAAVALALSQAVTRRRGSLTLKPAHFLAAFGVSTMLAYSLITGLFGGIAAGTYIRLVNETGGGKIAVTGELVNPDSRFWREHNFLVGSGPGQTVSRTANLTVPGAYNEVPPARALGIPEAQHFDYFRNLAVGFGYVGESSFSSPNSSLLGLLGDLGLLGLLAYLAALVTALRRLVSLGRTVEVVAMWLSVVLVLGFVSEWLEFPVATISLAAITAVMGCGERAVQCRSE